MIRVAAGSLAIVAALAPGPPAANQGIVDPGDPADSCSTAECHASYRAVEHAHRPVAVGVCTMCHRQVRDADHEFRLARAGASLCAPCHTEIETAGNVHTDSWPGGCTICHDPHGTGFRFMLPAADVADACLACHADVLDEGSFHLPVADESCTLCHDPHRSSHDTPAVVEASVCFRCHETTGATLAAAAYGHEPAAAGRCADCHGPHGSGTPANLREAVPGLCYQCHDDVEHTVETAPFVHSVAREPGGCLVCHTPHASSVSSGLRADPLTLCGGCHSDPIATGDGRTVEPVTRQIETNRYLHGPVRQRDCGGCHDAHGSDVSRLLVEYYTPEFYEPFAPEHYMLCFGCHPQRKVLTERSTALTDFRNGDANLHYVHVNKTPAGRTCRACHATHGSDVPKHIRPWVMYGNWKLPIEFDQTETGGHCVTGCHAPRSYDREVPVAYGAEDREPAGEEQPRRTGQRLTKGGQP